MIKSKKIVLAFASLILVVISFFSYNLATSTTQEPIIIKTSVPLQNSEVPIVSPVSGTVKKIVYPERTALRAGEVIIEIENLDLISKVYKAQAALAVAQAELAKARMGPNNYEKEIAKNELTLEKYRLEKLKNSVSLVKSLVEEYKNNEKEFLKDLSQTTNRLKILIDNFQKTVTPPDNQNVNSNPDNNNRGIGDNAQQSGSEGSGMMQHHAAQSEYLVKIYNLLTGIEESILLNDKNQTLKTSLDFKKQMNELKRNLEELQKEVKIAEIQVKLKELQYLNLLSKPDKEEVNLKHALVEKAKVELEIAKANLNAGYVKAPATGTLKKINVAEGEFITEGKLLGILEKPYEFYFDLTVPVDKIDSIQRGDKVMFRIEGHNDSDFAGTVLSIDTDFSAQGLLFKSLKGFYRVRISGEDTTGLLKTGIKVTEVIFNPKS
ncbi:hemolysin D [Carboxydothermus islandicus]|uniref:Hemolysin D n=1 Tax=Carboxydothermus islandicus TaxID=661089 RepID=A0A1L8D210_9THEO|nr:HlyD family efflux transporter periplasmic adaptor subunit [Carboxydothermus islandicus]GAV25183.1 hemolysin D [Carboxydothermus islandicus]